MSDKLTFDELKEKHLSTLQLYVPIVAKVHGKNHPEFREVRQLFESIEKKLKESLYEKPHLQEEFDALQKVTNNYSVPADACESYEAVYHMLSEMDQAYRIES